MKIRLTKRFFSPRKAVLIVIMKTFLLLVSTAMFSFTSNDLFSQSTKIVINQDKIVTVDEVFEIIKAQTNDYMFIYREDLFRDLPSIKLKKGVIGLNRLLNKTLSGSKLDIIVTKNNTILLKAKKSKYKQQEQEVKGRVKDVEGLPLPGVTVHVKGTSIGVITNIDGYYKISVPHPENVLVFSSLGYTLQEITVNEQDVINVTMEEKTSALEEVVLTGYQKLNKERSTGSFVKLNQRELDNRITSNVLDKIVSITPGLLQGSDGQLSIRGTSTFYGSKDPLIVVDGFPLGTNSYRTVNPEDVESVTVLKDAAASSIWGVRAANGVIVITTKSNKESKTKISFSSFLSTQNQMDYNSMPLASVQNIVDYEYNGYKNGNLFLSDNIYNNYSDVAFIYLDEVAGNITSTEARSRLNQLGSYNIIDENAEHFLRSRVEQQYNLSISGGSKLMDYYFSTFYNKTLYNLQESNADRLNLNSKNTFKISDKFNVLLNTNLTFSNSSNQGGDARGLRAYQRLTDENGAYIPVNTSVSQRVKDQVIGLGFLDWNYNPIQDREFIDNNSKRFDGRFQIGAEWNIIKGLEWNSSFQYEYSHFVDVNYNKEGSYRSRDIYNQYTSTFRTLDPVTGNEFITGINQHHFPKGGIYKEGNTTYKNYNVRNQLNIDVNPFNDSHEINAIVGSEIQEFVVEGSNTGDIYGFSDDTYFGTPINFNRVEDFKGIQRNNPSGIPTKTFEKDRFVSFFANAGYNYLNKYSFTASARIDQTNLFGQDPKYKYKPLWSVGGAWVISKENFFQSNFVDFLKVRATYGFNGNIDKGTSPFLRIEVLPPDFNVPFPKAIIVSPANPLLRWEQTEITNIGLDFGLFKSRVSGSLEFYWKSSTDLLMEKDLDPSLGFDRAFVNAGAMKNKGVDIDLKVKVLDGENLKFNTNFNLGFNKNEVVKFESGTYTARQLINRDALVVGEDLNSIYSYQWQGLTNTGQMQVLDMNGNVVEINENTDINEVLENDSDVVVNSGTRIPKFYGGAQFFVDYKGFNLSAYFSYKFGHSFYRPTVSYGTNVAAFNTRFVHEDLNDRWQNPGDENITDVLASPTTNNDSNRMSIYLNSNHLVEDASFVNLDQISVGYQLPERFTQPIGIEGMSFNFQVTNIGNVWTANKFNIDPENSFAPNREPNYTLGLRFNF
ncbi:SusC/RagA family TonB-linked outer membrane protein [Winogradskyella bathintestinalis]|uniref:SusC/RagA family TonB-linked outer membrane protein n=1 Tax=Winogradskyella bathintestinalis TaxID=3035208 RepID=A0ABT7ZX25_9FLAO|nr:SusC/RagA family TonB-linked outer membrane protein [Winogradskyella bathintestinalis]MDN3493389.1 SusC/RagA family TonB-linked outer membrane protein [Winogradskyella bathintestinalis]